MKTYTPPRLIPKGDVTELTMGMFPGDNDPNGISQHLTVGSVGFGL